MNNPLRYSDPAGHRACEDMDCRNDGDKKPIKGENGDKDRRRKPGDPLCNGTACEITKTLLTGGSYLLDGASLIVSAGAALVSDMGYYGAAQVCVASKGAGCGHAFSFAWGVDYFLSSGVAGAAENFLSGGAALLTAGNDVVSGNTGFDPVIGPYIGKDTVVSARNSIAGLIPESNIDALVSVSQVKYDIDRISGNKPGGYVPIFASDSGWKLPPFSREFVSQFLFKDWW